ncbi:MAG: DUF192 domain-containing protein [Kofleriaceae bacterium]
MRRLTLTFLVTAACSNGPKRDDAPIMPVHQDSPAVATPTVSIATPGGEATVNVEIVSTAPKIERGLMYREHLATDAGMLFLMGRDHDWAFYMRNTLIPLDMIFITRELTVAGVVANAEPRTETLRKVNAPSLYVLEVNGGWAAAHKVTAGAKVRFDGVKRP